MLVSLVLFIVGVPVTGKYQRVCKVVLEIGYPAALVLFGISPEKTDRERKNAVSGISVILE